MAKNPKRPKDPVSRAVMIGRILLGEQKDPEIEDKKDPRAKAAGAKGGLARAKAVTQSERSAIARKAAAKRWSNKH